MSGNVRFLRRFAHASEAEFLKCCVTKLFTHPATTNQTTSLLFLFPCSMLVSHFPILSSPYHHYPVSPPPHSVHSCEISIPYSCSFDNILTCTVSVYLGACYYLSLSCSTIPVPCDSALVLCHHHSFPIHSLS